MEFTLEVRCPTCEELYPDEVQRIWTVNGVATGGYAPAGLRLVHLDHDRHEAILEAQLGSEMGSNPDPDPSADTPT